MGCAAAAPERPQSEQHQSPKEAQAATPGGIIPNEPQDVGASYEIWNWRHLPKGCGGPPNRRSHERHLRKLNHFLLSMDETPLAQEVGRKRDALDEVPTSHSSR